MVKLHGEFNGHLTNDDSRQNSKHIYLKDIRTPEVMLHMNFWK